MTNFEMDLFDTRMSNYKTEKDEDQCCSSSRNRLVKPACLPITIISLFIIGLVFLPLFNDEDLESPGKLSTICSQQCSLQLVESIPTGLNFSDSFEHMKTYETWKQMLDGAQKFVDIAALYWNLNESDYPTSNAGKLVYQSIINAAKRGVKVRIAQDISQGLSNNKDSRWLAENGLAQVRTLNFSKLLGSGVLHTKFIIVDLKHIYIGSANMDWKSLTEVKELGVYVKNCPCVATDLYRIFAVYWRLGEIGATIPTQWPISFRTIYNARNPMNVNFNGKKTSVYISSSPAAFNPKGREHDLDSIVGLITRAQRSVCVAVMDFMPQTLYMGNNNSYWPILDDVLRSAAFRGVNVRMLVSKWDHSRAEEIEYLRSMIVINPALPTKKGARGKIEVKLFEVPSTKVQKKIKFARVNHNKYMLTDDTAYIGTSNWVGDYFISTAGVGLSMKSTDQDSIVQQLQEVFDRDWVSPYTKRLV